MQNPYVDSSDSYRPFRNPTNNAAQRTSVSSHSSASSYTATSAGHNSAPVMAPVILGNAPEDSSRSYHESQQRRTFMPAQSPSSSSSPSSLYGRSSFSNGHHSASMSSTGAGGVHDSGRRESAGNETNTPLANAAYHHRGSLESMTPPSTGDPHRSYPGLGVHPSSSSQFAYGHSSQPPSMSFSGSHFMQPPPPQSQGPSRSHLMGVDGGMLSSSPSSSESSHSQFHAASQVRPVAGATPLRRGQACQACRRRKLKCDAVRPICGTCEKSRRAAAQANHVSPVPEGDCVYDDVPATGMAPTATGVGGESELVSPMISPSMSAASSSTFPSLDDRSAFKRQRTSGSSTPSASQPGMRDTRTKSNSHGGMSIGGGFMSDVTRTSSPLNETSEQRAARLEARVSELEEKLRQARWHQGQSWEVGGTPRRFRSRASSRELDNHGQSFRPAVPIISMLSPLSGREEHHRMLYFQRPARSSNLLSTNRPPVTSTSAYQATTVNAPVANSMLTDHTTVPTLNATMIDATDPSSQTTDEAFMQLLWPGWSSDLPSADIVTSLCQIFFRLHPLRHIVYKPSFMSGLLLPPRHPHRPHGSLIHAILCAAADISPFFEPSGNVSGVRDRYVPLLSDPFSRPNLQQPQSADMLTFKEFHLSKARQKVERSLITEFKNPLDWLAAGLITVYVLWNDGRFVEAYFLSAFVARASAPSGLDKLPSRHFKAPGKLNLTPGIFGEPQGIEEHERRMVFWHCFIADQYTSGPPSFYENMLNEQACQTHLPCKISDFVAGNDAAPNPQVLSSPDLFTSGHLDDFTLHIKSVVLLRRAATLICRTQMIRAKASGVAIIDRHIDEFLSTFPPMKVHESSCDSLIAHCNVSLALFYLHESYLDKAQLCSISEGDQKPASSNGRIVLGVERTMTVMHELMNTSLDFALLHPQMFLGWSVCARMLGKDMMLLHQRIHQHQQQQQKGDATTQAASGSSTAADDARSLARVSENLDAIVQALRRGGVKSVKAKRCAELVSSVRSGHLHEGVLSHLLYLDGVIPVEDDMGNGVPAGPGGNGRDLALALGAALSAASSSSTAAPFSSQSNPFDMLTLAQASNGASDESFLLSDPASSSIPMGSQAQPSSITIETVAGASDTFNKRVEAIDINDFADGGSGASGANSMLHF